MGRLIRKQSEQTFQQLLADYRIEIKRLNFYITKFDSNEKRDKGDNHVLMISILISFLIYDLSTIAFLQILQSHLHYL